MSGNKMSFVYVDSTGHVLSYVTTVAALSGTLQAQDLATPTLSVRDVFDNSAIPKTVAGVEFKLTPDLLAVFTDDVLTDALLNPRNYWWNPQTKKIEVIPSPTTFTANCSSSNVTLTLNPPPNPNTRVLLVYPGADPTKSETKPASISSSGAVISLAGVASKSYVLILVAGYPPVISQVP